jgi:hypothetical protein
LGEGGWVGNSYTTMAMEVVINITVAVSFSAADVKDVVM